MLTTLATIPLLLRIFAATALSGEQSASDPPVKLVPAHWFHKVAAIRSWLLATPPRQIDELCSEIDDSCYVILDAAVNFYGRLIVFRRIQKKGSGLLGLTDARIIPELPLTWQSMNTRDWMIDKSTVLATYAQTMIVGTFAWGALQLNATKEQNVLIIGSAGGVISNFLSSLPNQKIAVTSVEIDSVMKEIAERWFDFDESPSHQLIIEDGVDYVRKAAEKGIKYDAILLDVNHNSELPLLAPVEAFLASDVIRNMRRILSSSGTAVVNIITLKPEFATAYAHEIKRLFNEQFPSCYVKSQGFTERMLFCPADMSNSWEMNASEIRRRYAEAKEAFKFELA